MDATCRPADLRRCGFNLWVEIGSQPGQLDQAAASRLDGFGLFAIGDIVSSGLRRVLKSACEVTDSLYDYAFILVFIQYRFGNFVAQKSKPCYFVQGKETSMRINQRLHDCVNGTAQDGSISAFLCRA